MALKRELGYEDIGIPFSNLGLVAEAQGDYLTARHYFNKSLQIFKKKENKWGIGIQLSQLAGVATIRGELQTAQAHYKESLQLFEEQGSKWGISYALSGLANVELLSGTHRDAQALYQKSLTLAQELNNHETIIRAVVGLAKSLKASKSTQDMVRVLAAVKALQTTKEARMPTVARYLYEQALADARDLLDDATFEATWAKGSAMTIEEAIDYVLERVQTNAG